MKRKPITIAALVLVVALICGVFWYMNQPATVEGPAEDGEITANSEPAESTPETEDSEAKENTPEIEGDSEPAENDPETEEDGDGAPPVEEQYDFENMTEEEIQAFIDEQKQAMEEAHENTQQQVQQILEDAKNQAENNNNNQQQQGNGNNQQQSSGGTSQSQPDLSGWDLSGMTTGDKSAGAANNNPNYDGPAINWK